MEENILGNIIRHRRRQLGLSLDDVAAVTRISKPYLSLIETGRVPNPPSAAKLCQLETVLKMERCQLRAHADIHRTPKSVIAALQALLDTMEPSTTPPFYQSLYEVVRQGVISATVWCGDGI